MRIKHRYVNYKVCQVRQAVVRVGVSGSYPKDTSFLGVSDEMPLFRRIQGLGVRASAR